MGNLGSGANSQAHGNISCPNTDGNTLNIKFERLEFFDFLSALCLDLH